MTKERVTNSIFGFHVDFAFLKPVIVREAEKLSERVDKKLKKYEDE